MKKLAGIIMLMFLVMTGTAYAQTATPATKAASTKKKADQEVKAAKSDAKADAQSTGAKLKKDGTPDKRYAENKNLKKDGTPDKRFKTAKADSLKTAKKKN